jgi:hypothetical protein
MPYAHTTFGTLKTDLALRLGDSGNVYWANAELGRYIVESLRTWNGLAAYWRDRGVFASVNAQPFYDLGSVLAVQLGRSVTDAQIETTILDSLLEPVTIPYAGTEQFTQADITAAMQKRRDQFLLETGSVLSHATQVSPITPTGRFNLPDTTIDVRRAAFQDAGGTFTNLWREDEFAMTSYLPNWSVSPGNPQAYSLVVTPPVQLQIAPPPAMAGILDLVTVDTGAALNPAAGVALGVPEDFSWAIKWGALADLLGRDGPGRDPQRSAYCEKRWQEGVEVCRLTTSVLEAQIDGVPQSVDSLFDLDTFNGGWQSLAPQTPTIVAMAGLNLLVLAPPPNAPHSVTADILRNIPVPAVDADQVVVGREVLNVVLDYAEHLAAFKMGGTEFEATVGHYARLVRLAQQQNERWRAQAKLAEVLHDRARREEEFNRRRARPQPVPIAANMEGGI